MKRIWIIVAIVMLAFASASYGQHIDYQSVELGGEDSVRIEAVGFAGPVPARVVFSANVPPFEWEGELVVRIVLVYDLLCDEGVLRPLRYVLINEHGQMTSPFRMEPETITPEAGSTLAIVYEHTCARTYGTGAMS